MVENNPLTLLMLLLLSPVSSAVEAQRLPTPSGSKVPRLGRLEWATLKLPG
jgi:hypothetical protein